METKGSQNVSANNLSAMPLEEDDVVYIAIKGSLHAHDCSVFGLGNDEVVALTKKFSGSGAAVINGIQIKTNAIKAINALSQLGYRVVSSSGEGETTWTLQHMEKKEHSNCNCHNSSANASVHQTLSEMDWERGIWNAAFSGDKDRIINLIGKSRNAEVLVNTPDNSGYGALHYAASRGHVEICDMLLKHGAFIDMQTRSGKATPLHKAVAAGKSSTLKILIENGANVELQDADGKTVLHKAVENNHTDLIPILLKASPKLCHIKDNKGNIANI